MDKIISFDEWSRKCQLQITLCDPEFREKAKYIWDSAMEAQAQKIKELESFRTAYMEWSDKTDWLQTDKRFDILKPWGKHRADTLRLYIDHLESTYKKELDTAKVCLPYHLDDRYKVKGSWIGSVQNYISHLEKKLQDNGISIDDE